MRYDFQTLSSEQRQQLRTFADENDNLFIPTQGRSIRYLIDAIEHAEAERDALQCQVDAPACFNDGLPTNLAAAALDAIEWLRVLRDLTTLDKSSSARLGRAIDALDQHLVTHLPARFETKDEAL